MTEQTKHTDGMAVGHTPGPWHADHINSWNVWASDCKVAKCFDVGQAEHYREPSEDERVANARLIASAPELLEALGEAFETLTYIFECSDDDQASRAAKETADKINVVCARARGEAS